MVRPTQPLRYNDDVELGPAEFIASDLLAPDSPILKEVVGLAHVGPARVLAVRLLNLTTRRILWFNAREMVDDGLVIPINDEAHELLASLEAARRLLGADSRFIYQKTRRVDW